MALIRQKTGFAGHPEQYNGMNAQSSPLRGRPRISPTIRLQALELLAAGHNQKSTATKLGISPDSVAKWQKDPDFQKQVDERRGFLIGDYRQSLNLLVPKAIVALHDILAAGNAAARIKAIDLILRSAGVLGSDQAQGNVTVSGEIKFNPIGIDPKTGGAA